MSTYKQLVLTDALRELDHRIGLLEDAAQIENLHAMYGYYLATFEWDALTDLFAPNGSIEIALRGVYVGQALSASQSQSLRPTRSRRRGVAQSYAVSAPSSMWPTTDKPQKCARERLSMMGEFGKSGMWMGGVYENEFIKIDGIWRIKSDHVVNTYFAPLRRGMEKLSLTRSARH